jgi:serine phosphatase RsbU (regulator of sigma subunit)
MEVWGGNTAVDDLVSVPGVDAHVLSVPHQNAAGGGDIHYVSTCAAGIISRFVLADVAGHGAGVGDIAVSLRQLMRKHINTPDQSRFSRSLNEEFGKLTTAGRFATAVMATYFAPSDHLILCNAGHPPPLWWRAELRRWEFLTHESPAVLSRERRKDLGIANLPLGIIEPTNYHQFAALLGRGDLVVFYTDAFVEAADRVGDQLGQAGLLQMAEQLGTREPHALGPALLSAVRAYRDGAPADDDATLLVLHHNAADPPSLPIGERIKVWGRMLGLLD